MNYRLAYAIGFHPWEDLAEHPPFARKAHGARGSRGKRARAALRSGVWTSARERSLGRSAREPRLGA